MGAIPAGGWNWRWGAICSSSASTAPWWVAWWALLIHAITPVLVLAEPPGSARGSKQLCATFLTTWCGSQTPPFITIHTPGSTHCTAPRAQPILNTASESRKRAGCSAPVSTIRRPARPLQRQRGGHHGVGAVGDEDMLGLAGLDRRTESAGGRRRSCAGCPCASAPGPPRTQTQRPLCPRVAPICGVADLVVAFVVKINFVDGAAGGDDQ